MKMRFLGVLFFAVLAYSAESFADSQARIGTVDLQRAVSESTEGAKDRAELLKKKNQLAESLKPSFSELEKMRSELEKGTKISADERAEKERLFQKLGRDYQNRQREAQEELKQTENDYLKKLLTKFGVLLKKIGDDDNFTVILDRNSGVVYAGTKTDVTSKLVKKADEEYQKE